MGMCAAKPAEQEVPQVDPNAPFHVRFHLMFHDNTGSFVAAFHPGWAPLGAARMKELVNMGYYGGNLGGNGPNDTPSMPMGVYRVIDGFMAQFGIHGNPQLYQGVGMKVFPDDPVKASNTRGTISFAMRGPQTRSCQIFVNFGDNTALDAQGFAPVGVVVEGFDQVERIYAGYGDRGQGGPNPADLKEQGNSYLAAFPKLTMITKAEIITQE